jgi:hypothetical protein
VTKERVEMVVMDVSGPADKIRRIRYAMTLIIDRSIFPYTSCQPTKATLRRMNRGQRHSGLGKMDLKWFREACEALDLPC